MTIEIGALLSDTVVGVTIILCLAWTLRGLFK